jgi:hypothetical protein
MDNKDLPQVSAATEKAQTYGSPSHLFTPSVCGDCGDPECPECVPRMAAAWASRGSDSYEGGMG